MSEADVDLDCSACGEPIALPQKNWLPCAECDRAYHLYCLRPPLAEKPRGRWLCPAHSRDNAVEVKIDEVSDRYLQLHLFPYHALPKVSCSKRRCRRAPMQAIEPPQIHRLHHEIALGRMLKEKRDTPILQSLMRKNKNKLVGDYFEELKHSQAQLVAEALDMQTVANIDLEASHATATLQKLASLSPLFVQFLAWQRLMQLPDEVGLLDRGAACEALEGTALKKRKRLPEDVLVPEPDPVPKKQQKTSRASSLAPRVPEPKLTASSPVPAPTSPAGTPEPEREPTPPPVEKEASPEPLAKKSPPEKAVSLPFKSTRRNQRKSALANRKAAEQRKKEQEDIHAAMEAEESATEPADASPPASSKPSSPPPASPPVAQDEDDPMETSPPAPSAPITPPAPAPEPEAPSPPPPTAKSSPPSTSKPSPVANKPKKVARKSSLGLDDETESMTESASFASTRTPRQSLNDASSVDATPPRATAPESSPLEPTKEEAPKEEPMPETPTQIRITVTAEILTEPKIFVLPVEKLPARVGRNDPRGPPPKKSLAVNLQEVSNHPTVKRVSHFHMEIMKRGDYFFLLCLGRNGVQVDDGVVTKNQCIPLHSGRIVGVGPFQIRFQLI